MLESAMNTRGIDAALSGEPGYETVAGNAIAELAQGGTEYATLTTTSPEQSALLANLANGQPVPIHELQKMVPTGHHLIGALIPGRLHNDSPVQEVWGAVTGTKVVMLGGFKKGSTQSGIRFQLNTLPTYNTEIMTDTGVISALLAPQIATLDTAGERHNNRSQVMTASPGHVTAITAGVLKAIPDGLNTHLVHSGGTQIGNTNNIAALQNKAAGRITSHPLSVAEFDHTNATIRLPLGTVHQTTTGVEVPVIGPKTLAAGKAAAPALAIAAGINAGAKEGITGSQINDVIGEEVQGW